MFYIIALLASITNIAALCMDNTAIVKQQQINQVFSNYKKIWDTINNAQKIQMSVAQDYSQTTLLAPYKIAYSQFIEEVRQKESLDDAARKAINKAMESVDEEDQKKLPNLPENIRKILFNHIIKEPYTPSKN